MRDIALRIIIFLPTDCVPAGLSELSDGNAPASGVPSHTPYSAIVPACAGDALVPTFSYGTGNNAYSVCFLQSCGDTLVVWRFGIELLQLSSCASVLSLALVDQGPFIAQGAQDFIGPILLAFQGIGQSLQGRIQEIEAAQSFRNVSRVYPEDLETYSTLGSLYHDRLFDFEAALALHQSWLERHPRDVSARENFAETAFTKGHFAEAEKQLQQAIQLEPENQGYLFSLAQAQLRRDNPTAALRTLEPLRLSYVDAQLRQHAEEMIKEIGRVKP